MTTPARETLTRLISVLHGWDAGPRANLSPQSRSIILDHNKARGLYRQPGNTTFTVFWVTGEFPPETKLTMRCDATDRMYPFCDTVWGPLSGRPHYLPEPMLIPPACTTVLDSTHAGHLTLHGMFNYQRYGRLSDDQDPGAPVREHPEHFLQQASELVKALKSLDEIMASAKDVPPPLITPE